MYCILMLNFEKSTALLSLCINYTNPEACKSYLIPQIINLDTWKQSYSGFSEQLDFCDLKTLSDWLLLKFYMLCFVSMLHLFSLGTL